MASVQSQVTSRAAAVTMMDGTRLCSSVFSSLTLQVLFCIAHCRKMLQVFSSSAEFCGKVLRYFIKRYLLGQVVTKDAVR